MKKIIVLVFVLILLANVAFASWWTGECTINYINYNISDFSSPELIVRFTIDSSSKVGEKYIPYNDVSQAKMMMAVLLSAFTTGQKCKFLIDGPDIVAVRILSDE